jgi:hypothetical protein
MNIRTATATLKSLTPYSQSRHYEVEKESSTESSRAYEERTWRGRMHTDEAGLLVIPAMSLKNCLAEAAKFLGKTVPGKGKATYTKHFEAGVMVTDSMATGLKAADVKPEVLFVPSDGVRGSGKRVTKWFPFIPAWTGTIDIVIIDDTISEQAFIDHLVAAGQFIGIGRFRPRNNGFYGRFALVDCTWVRNGKKYSPDVNLAA